jgi:predicted metal-dependent phosphoesterase TrpH
LSKRQRRADRTFGTADLHIHSLASDGLNSPRQILEYVEEETDLDVIAITDHDEISGALEARALWAKGAYSFDFVVGEEITTQSGHLVALDIGECIRMLQPLERTIGQIRAQGGLVIVPHPLAWYATGLRRWRIESVMQQPSDVHFDGLESFNATLAGRRTNREAVALTNALGLGHVGGSDSHDLRTIGSARTRFSGHSWHDLRRAVVERTSVAEGEFYGLSTYASIAVPQMFRSLVLLPAKRVKKMAGWFLEDRGLIGPESSPPPR